MNTPQKKIILLVVTLIFLSMTSLCLAMSIDISDLKSKAEQGNTDAQFNLGIIYHTGDGVSQDYNTAIKWYIDAAERGHLKAQQTLGVIYFQGEIIAPDHTEAAKWFKKAAEQGNAGCQFTLGAMYNEGLGVAQDYDEGVKWIKKAAEQGYSNAQESLALIYFQGKIVPQDYKKAVIWIRKLAKSGIAEFQWYLGDAYRDGVGAEQNNNEAVKWYKKAAEQGIEEAQKNFDSLCIGSPLANCPSTPMPEQWGGPAFIYFDSSNPAYCHMIAINNIEDFLVSNAGKEEEIKNKIIPGDDFYRNQANYLDGCQIINDYPGYNLKNEVAKILLSSEGAMFSLTWNGGIAVTRLDHKHTEEIYEQYELDPEGYLKLEKRRQKGDPIHPGNWLPALLRNYEKTLSILEQTNHVDRDETEESRIIGHWKGIDSSGFDLDIVLSQDGKFTMTHDNEEMSCEGMGIHCKFEWRLDATQNPVHLDLVFSVTSEESSTVPMIVKFINDNEILLQGSDDMVSRPIEFTAAEQVVLKKVTRDK